jgi:hypothetical protein
MEVKVIKLDDEHIEVDGVKYKKEENKIEAWCRSVPLGEYRPRWKIHDGEDYVVFGLPMANLDWSLKVFKYATACCAHFVDAYPVHGKSWMDKRELWIRVRGI